MIKAVPKPLEEIIDLVKDFQKVLVVGCDGCVTVCEAGGLKEVKVLGSALRLYFTQAEKRMDIDEATLTRQCDKEYLDELKDRIDNYDAVVSLACGCGVQYLAERYNDKIVYPGVDTCFMGVDLRSGGVCRALPGLRQMHPGQHRRGLPHRPLFQADAERPLRRLGKGQM
jgi:ferredoxin